MITQTELDNITESALVSSETVNETTTYTDAERQTNAMTSATKQMQLAAKRAALKAYEESTFAEKCRMQEEIEALEDELNDLNTGVTTGSLTKPVTYDVYNTGTELVSFKRGAQKIVANIVNSVSLNLSTSSSETTASDGNNETTGEETSSGSSVQEQLEQTAEQAQQAVTEGLNRLKNLFGKN